MPQMLIVDDEPDVRRCLLEFFAAKGFSVVTAFSGEEAIERLKQAPADVILLDLLLPGVSGIEVLKRAKELYPSVKVIIVTAVDQPELRTQAATYGAADYITKPFDFSETTWAQVFEETGSSPSA